MISWVLDASAVLALLNQEPGGDTVLPLLPSSIISTVNYSEVLAKLIEKGMESDTAEAILAMSGIDNRIDFDSQLAREAASLRPLTRQAGLSLGDRACLALARSRNLIAVTAERTWQALDLCEIRYIRP